MNGAEFVPVPVDLGQAIAFPGVYLEPPAGFPVTVPAVRVRRPRGILRKLAAAAAVAVTAGLAAAGWAGGAHAATVTPAAEWHACHMVVVFSRAVRADELTSGPAWHHAWDASGHADPDLKRAIRHYLDTGRGWSQVMWLCGSGL